MRHIESQNSYAQGVSQSVLKSFEVPSGTLLLPWSRRRRVYANGGNLRTLTRSRLASTNFSQNL